MQSMKIGICDMFEYVNSNTYVLQALRLQERQWQAQV